jgi:integrase
MVDGVVDGSVSGRESVPRRDRVAAHLVVRDRRRGPVIYGKWREDGKQVERKLGRGWLVRQGEPGAKPNGKPLGGWRERRGRPDEGHLTPDMARELLQEAVIRWQSEQRRRHRRGGRLITFADAGESWLLERRAVAGWKPTTERNYRAMLRAEDSVPRRRGIKPRARLMRVFGELDVAKIGVDEVRAFLRSLDVDPTLSARSVNAHRLVLSMVLAHAAERGWREGNPVDLVPKRREQDPAELIVYRPEQVDAIAAHATDETIAAMVIVAGTTGLRLGEGLELRWRDVRFAEQVVHVQRSWAAGLGATTPKGRRSRSIPLADPAAQALARLGQREQFTRPADLVFPNALGEHLDPTTVRMRYLAARRLAAREDPDLPTLSFHGLRHSFGSRCAAAGIDVVTIQRWMGHASIKTTMRYMHHAPAADDAQRLSRAFAAGAPAAVGVLP